MAGGQQSEELVGSQNGDTSLTTGGGGIGIVVAAISGQARGFHRRHHFVMFIACAGGTENLNLKGSLRSARRCWLR